MKDLSLQDIPVFRLPFCPYCPLLCIDGEKVNKRNRKVQGQEKWRAFLHNRSPYDLQGLGLQIHYRQEITPP